MKEHDPLYTTCRLDRSIEHEDMLKANAMPIKKHIQTGNCLFIHVHEIIVYTVFINIIATVYTWVGRGELGRNWSVKGPGTYFVATQPRCCAEFFARKFYFRFCVLFFPDSEFLRLLLVFKLFLKLFGFSNFQEFCFCISIMY